MEEVKVKYDLEFTDSLGDTQRIIKSYETTDDDEEGLNDLISGFISLLRLSGWAWIKDLKIIKDSDCV